MSKLFDASVSSLKNWANSRKVAESVETTGGVKQIPISHLIKVGGLYRIRENYEPVWRMEAGEDGRRYIVRVDSPNSTERYAVVDDTDSANDDDRRSAHWTLIGGSVYLTWECPCGTANMQRRGQGMEYLCIRCGETVDEPRIATEKPKNPWAICHTVIDKKKNPGKFERCVKKVKEQM